MATVLAEFTPRNLGGRPTKYPWLQWFDGNIWRLTHGVDFDLKLTSFRPSAITMARKLGYRLRYQVDYANGVIELQAMKGRNYAEAACEIRRRNHRQNAAVIPLAH